MKTIKNYPNYKINKVGKVIALNWNGTGKEKEITPWKQKQKGYLMVNLWDGKKQFKLSLHRLVASTFIGNIDGKLVDHIDRNPENNCVSNLRIVTICESNQNRNSRPMRNISKHRKKWVVSIRSNHKNYRASFDTPQDALKHRDTVLIKLQPCYTHGMIAMR